MSHGLLLTFEVTILVLAFFLGFEVISKVPTLLHTPLMSVTNAISSVIVVGALLAVPIAGSIQVIVQAAEARAEAELRTSRRQTSRSRASGWRARSR